jgi:hypothetical protein
MTERIGVHELHIAIVQRCVDDGALNLSVDVWTRLQVNEPDCPSLRKWCMRVIHCADGDSALKKIASLSDKIEVEWMLIL